MKSTVRDKELGTVGEILYLCGTVAQFTKEAFFPWTPASCPWPQAKWKLSDNLPSPAPSNTGWDQLARTRAIA